MRKAANYVAKHQTTKMIFSVGQSWENSSTEADSQEDIRRSKHLLLLQKPLEGISAACFSVNNRREAWGMSDPQIFSIRQRLSTDGEGGGAVVKKTEKLDQGMFYLLTPNILRSKRLYHSKCYQSTYKRLTTGA